MNKVILIPDSFKGNISSQEICQILGQEVHAFWPQAQVVSIPVADGGEGSVDAFLAAVGGEKVPVDCHGPLPDQQVAGFYGRLTPELAVVEMAAAAGLPQVGDRLRPDEATTYGVGQLILAAVRAGARRVIVGLGGSATNDGGCGCAAALGVRFLDGEGNAYLPTGGTLDRLAAIDLSGIAPELKGVELVAMCDIDNPLCGPNGASAIFGPQKGADPDMVAQLDRNLGHLADVVAQATGSDLRETPGAGAAGGLGFGLLALLGCRVQMGIDTILEVTGFDGLLEGADLVVTGEGKLDGQTLRGKVVAGVARHAQAKNVPVLAVVGDIGDGIEPIYETGVSSVISINRVALPFSQSKPRSRSDLRLTFRNEMHFLHRLGF